MELRILETASEDLLRGYHFYENQSPGVGDYFLETLFAEIDTLKIHGGQHPVRRGYYKMLSETFPYVVYYKIHDGSVVVRAVLDCRKDPAWIRKRLS